MTSIFGGPFGGGFGPEDPRQNNKTGIIVFIIGSVILIGFLFWIGSDATDFFQK
jgi:hypothetical protein